jgi:hypothetical protein
MGTLVVVVIDSDLTETACPPPDFGAVGSPQGPWSLRRFAVRDSLYSTGISRQYGSFA